MPQLKQLLKSEEFKNLLSNVERESWESLKDVIKNFLGNRKAENYEEIVKRLTQKFGNMGVNMSLKIHFLHNHLDFFPENLSDFSDKHGERFHQDLSDMESRLKGKDPSRMMAEYCWSICRDTNAQFKRQSKRICFS